MFLATASMKRLTDEEKIAFIRLLRQMKAVSQELNSAANDAYARAVADGMEDTKAMDFANRAVDDIAQAESDIATETMTKRSTHVMSYQTTGTSGKSKNLEQS